MIDLIVSPETSLATGDAATPPLFFPTRRMKPSKSRRSWPSETILRSFFKTGLFIEINTVDSQAHAIHGAMTMLFEACEAVRDLGLPGYPSSIFLKSEGGLRLAAECQFYY